MRLYPVVLLALVLAACTPRAQIDRVDPVPGAVLQPILVATTRAPDDTAGGEPGTRRDSALGFGRFTVAIPPAHQTGRLERPRGRRPADPALHFTLAAEERFDAAGFRQALAQALDEQARPQREVVIFVHGFNTLFIEGVYRVAQLGNDLALPGVLAHYAWPSLGAPLGYAHDRDSVLFARDGLATMISETARAGAPRIVLIAHSMGTHLLMETLRQMSLDGSLDRVRLGGVILLSPDIDVEVFRSQASRITRLPEPFLIVTSRRDRILQLSARLTGQPDRLGNLTDPTRLGDLPVTVLDITAFGSGEGHFTVAESPALIQLLGRIGAVDAALEQDVSGALPLIPGTILTLQTTTEALLNPAADSRTRRPVLPYYLLPRRMRPSEEPAPE